MVEATVQNFRLLFLTETDLRFSRYCDNEINKLSLSIISRYFIITMKVCNDFIKIWLFHNGHRYHIETSPLLRKSMDWFLFDNSLRHERVKWFSRSCSKWITNILQLSQLMITLPIESFYIFIFETSSRKFCLKRVFLWRKN